MHDDDDDNDDDYWENAEAFQKSDFEFFFLKI
jgi:hypothetical protein